jgi:hypothetical protein
MRLSRVRAITIGLGALYSAAGARAAIVEPVMGDIAPSAAFTLGGTAMNFAGAAPALLPFGPLSAPALSPITPNQGAPEIMAAAVAPLPVAAQLGAAAALSPRLVTSPPATATALPAPVAPQIAAPAFAQGSEPLSAAKMDGLGGPVREAGQIAAAAPAATARPTHMPSQQDLELYRRVVDIANLTTRNWVQFIIANRSFVDSWRGTDFQIAKAVGIFSTQFIQGQKPDQLTLRGVNLTDIFWKRIKENGHLTDEDMGRFLRIASQLNRP